MTEKGSVPLRKKVVELLCRVEQQGSFASQLMDGVRREQGFSDRQKKLIEQLLKSCVERQQSLNELLNTRLKKPVSQLPSEVRAVLQLALYQIQFSNSVPAALVVNESVELLKKGKYSGLSKLVNAVLRGLIRDIESGKLRTEIEEQGRFDHPEWLVARWERQFGAEQARKLCEFNNTVWPLCIRLNTLRSSMEELQSSLRRDNVQFHAAAYHPEALIVTRLPADRSLNDLQSFEQGLFQVQDESSLFVTDVLDPKPGERILDLCAAPGGKATHIAQRLGGEGSVVALDLHASRVSLIEDNCKRLGIENIECICADALSYESESSFDRVLLDAPCSGLGVIGRKSEMRWRKSEADFEELNALQDSLLAKAAEFVKPGGFLVYSTCSIDPCENEERVRGFLEERSDLELQTIHSERNELVSEAGFYQSLPHLHHMGGAFAALMRRRYQA